MVTCFYCAKGIKGKMVVHNPPLYLIHLGVDLLRKYHPKCYEKSEEEAKQELNLKHEGRD